MLYFSGDVVGRYIEPWDQLPAITPSRLQSIVERLTAATGPWQDWAIDLQHIYRWDDPKRTGKWLAAYLFFLSINHMATFFLGYIILQTLRNRYRPSPDSLRISLERSRNQGMSAHRMKELMQQHPNGEWIYPLFDALGPDIQLQMLDTATILETIQNFWEWRSPRYTAQTLSWMILGLFASYFVPVETMLRLTYLGIGFIFFACFPIASRYPKYRLVVSPLRWIFWGIPDNGMCLLRCSSSF
ncbi:hypothetical protein BJ508DRAFT_212834 [Ascobolus immersus RN42]|uniref:Uncharacterized protein n=1 Tax=Ascobolus immersus RN42 TaxID=1160509 RepID=A0A3N4I6B8_ASCIM|nr:hypothetical protein BJ508DRAFT_212834 [Ascobolus immersus RN42]